MTNNAATPTSSHNPIQPARPAPVEWPPRTRAERDALRDRAIERAHALRAEAIADALPAQDPDRTAMRIAPRTMLCGIAWRVQVNVAGDRFEELRELCTAAGDKASLAIAMAGLVIGFLAGMATDRIRHDRERGVVLAKYEQALQQWRQHLMAIERDTRRD